MTTSQSSRISRKLFSWMYFVYNKRAPAACQFLKIVGVCAVWHFFSISFIDMLIIASYGNVVTGMDVLDKISYWYFESNQMGQNM